ncbi:hypothetical protein CVT25_009644 [Psilocybe cyanescens]|uniref:Fungal-type protein kinase domain-containing protein n=1 Tax=Psilocybe cyanescens TaxID=93625 RepID=A0A409XGX3_PSICY|nr:hypothetical protein CVT25_009644 [Psilocybe cyanescens]
MPDSQVLELPARITNDPVTPVNTNAPTVQQTPVTYKSATQVHAMDVPLSDDAYKLVGGETKGHYLVGITPTKFLEEFLPWNASTPDIYKQQVPDQAKIYALQSVPPRRGQKESHMYSPFVKALDGWVTGADSGQKLRFGHFAKPDSSCVSMNVDVSTYWEQDYPVIQGPEGPEPGSCTFSHQQTHEELKSDHTHDAFKHSSDEGPMNEATAEDAKETAEGAEATQEANEIFEETADEVSNKVKNTAEETPEDVQTQVGEQGEAPANLIEKVEADTQRGIHTRGQIAAYAGVAMSMAFRTHFFSMLILGKYARLIRWDRRGAIVTNRFDYTKRPELIFTFYLRFGQLSLPQRGFDTSAVALDKINQVLPDKVAHAFDNYYQRSWHKGAKFGHQNNLTNEPQKPANTLPFFRIAVEDRTLDKTESFFIPAPVFRHTYLTPFARASRRFMAFLDDPKDGKMCFLKDSWQEVSARTAPEADIYRKLHAKNVEHIASMRLGGDVAGLETKTQVSFDKLSHSGRYKKLGRMVCHRIILDTVARDLGTFTWCKVLLSCLADVVDAAQQAYKAGVLHRDISAGNVMIVKDKETKELRGILIDWDMCLLIDERKKNYEIRTARTGTWAFISARLLRSSPSKPAVHSLGDDMESVFWVLAYEVLRYTKHNLSPSILFQTMQHLFADAKKSDGIMVGGKGKLSTLISCSAGMTALELADFKMDTLHGVFNVLGTAFKPRYDNEANVKVAKIFKLSADPLINWDSPDDKWFSTFLRQAAEVMAPLGVTPTGLESPTNDSKPPANSALLKRAKLGLYPADYYEMEWLKDENDSERAQSNFIRATASTCMNHIEGISYSTSKRPYVDDDVYDAGSEERAPAKKHRPMS